jgi:hypothetical protein
VQLAWAFARAARPSTRIFLSFRWYNENPLRRSRELPTIISIFRQETACAARNARRAFPEWLRTNFAPIAALFYPSLACCVPKR